MSQENQSIYFVPLKTTSEGLSLLEKLLSGAHAGSIFIQSVSRDDVTVVTAAELSAVVGFGLGAGIGSPQEVPPEASQDFVVDGFGGGGGGGGGTRVRPIAAIIVEPQGVRVEPIVDFNTIMVAFFTTLGAIFAMGNRIRRTARGK
ncbi:MAG: hypothetical protein JXB35_11985 [Anaerolineae bacterium]|nr:hypothetical protein [Anaerolineae bacterium]